MKWLLPIALIGLNAYAQGDETTKFLDGSESPTGTNTAITEVPPPTIDFSESESLKALQDINPPNFAALALTPAEKLAKKNLAGEIKLKTKLLLTLKKGVLNDVKNTLKGIEDDVKSGATTPPTAITQVAFYVGVYRMFFNLGAETLFSVLEEDIFGFLAASSNPALIGYTAGDRSQLDKFRNFSSTVEAGLRNQISKRVAQFATKVFNFSGKTYPINFYIPQNRVERGIAPLDVSWGISTTIIPELEYTILIAGSSTTAASDGLMCQVAMGSTQPDAGSKLFLAAILGKTVSSSTNPTGAELIPGSGIMLMGRCAVGLPEGNYRVGMRHGGLGFGSESGLIIDAIGIR